MNGKHIKVVLLQIQSLQLLLPLPDVLFNYASRWCFVLCASELVGVDTPDQHP